MRRRFSITATKKITAIDSIRDMLNPIGQPCFVDFMAFRVHGNFIYHAEKKHQLKDDVISS